jgi:hypothetical protein
VEATTPNHQVAWVEEARLVRVRWLPGAVCDLDAAQASTAAIAKLGRDRCPLLVDMREMTSLERPAREHFVSDHGNTSAIALLVGSPVTRMMANFFIGMRRMPVPIRMFTDETDAIEWLDERR